MFSPCRPCPARQRALQRGMSRTLSVRQLDPVPPPLVRLAQILSSQYDYHNHCNNFFKTILPPSNHRLRHITRTRKKRTFNTNVRKYRMNRTSSIPAFGSHHLSLPRLSGLHFDSVSLPWAHVLTIATAITVTITITITIYPSPSLRLPNSNILTLFIG